MTGPTRTKDEGGVGCAIGDYDNDGDLDIFAPNYGHNLLYRNNGNGTFTDVAKEVGVGVENHAVGADWGDYRQRRRPRPVGDFLRRAGGQQEPLNALFRNDGAAGFVNVLTKDSPLNAGDHGTQFVDYDHDGGLDLTITDGYGPVGGHFVFRNTLPDEVKQRSLSVLGARRQGPPHALRRGGAAVRRAGQGSWPRARCRPAAATTRSARRRVHFGLAAIQPVRVEVTFMTAHGRKTQTLNNVNPADVPRQEPGDPSDRRIDGRCRQGHLGSPPSGSTMSAMRRRPLLQCVGLGLLALVLASERPAAQPGVTAITGATLIDGTGGAPVPDAVVIIDGRAHHGRRVRASSRDRAGRRHGDRCLRPVHRARASSTPTSTSRSTAA